MDDDEVKNNLNTLYVDIKRMLISKEKQLLKNLNTLYVDIKQ